MSPLARICGHCGALIPAGQAHRHGTPSEQRKNHRPNATSVYNTSRWRKLRASVLLRDDHTCWCGVHGPSHGVSMTVHHLEPFTGSDDPKAWDAANLVTLCPTHHGQQHGGAH